MIKMEGERTAAVQTQQIQVAISAAVTVGHLLRAGVRSLPLFQSAIIPRRIQYFLPAIAGSCLETKTRSVTFC